MNQPHQLDSGKLINFPGLTRRNHQVTSKETDDYNCAAWAANVDDLWWWPVPIVPEHYWPPGVRRDNSPQAFLEAYATLGFEDSGTNGALETGIEKIAVYYLGDMPTHVARQLVDGRWASKLGHWEDIEHLTARDVEGLGQYCYGRVSFFMRRPRA